jgi:hypothetical protein
MNMDMDLDFDFQEAMQDIEMFVSSLSDFNVITMSNDLPDIRVIDCKYNSELYMILQQELGDVYIQTIVNNLNKETQYGCPYFRICTTPLSNENATNFKLQKFYKSIGLGEMNARCKKAVVVGMASMSIADSPIAIPSAFCSTKIFSLELFKEPELDISCLKSCAQHLYPENSTLCDIAGICLPCHFPREVQDLIMTFCSSPSADIIRDEMYRLCRQWDLCMFPMFLQREPRIPVHIASFYGARNVQMTVRDATRSSLAMGVPRRGLNANQ